MKVSFITCYRFQHSISAAQLTSEIVCRVVSRHRGPSKPNKTHFINNRTVFDFIKLLSTV